MPKTKKTLCVDSLRHAEYYGMQPIFDDLYEKSKGGEKFKDLMKKQLLKTAAASI